MFSISDRRIEAPSAADSSSASRSASWARKLWTCLVCAARAKFSLRLHGGFTPENQDRVALQQIRERLALEDIKAGRIADAIAKCSSIWASFPGNTYGQNPHRLDKLMAQWAKLGGVLA